MTPKNDPKIYDKEYFKRCPSFYNPQRFHFHTGIIIGTGAKKVVDIGCGPNTLCKMLRQNGVDALGTDFSPDSGADMLCSATDLPFEDNEFDLLFSCDLLEHLEPDMVDKALSEFCRVSKRQAHHVCTEDDDIDPATGEMPDFHEAYHLTSESRVWWLQKFMQHGLLVEFEYHMYMSLVVGPSPMLGTLCNHLWLFRGEEGAISFS